MGGWQSNPGILSSGWTLKPVNPRLNLTLPPIVDMGEIKRQSLVVRWNANLMALSGPSGSKPAFPWDLPRDDSSPTAQLSLVDGHRSLTMRHMLTEDRACTVDRHLPKVAWLRRLPSFQSSDRPAVKPKLDPERVWA